MKNYSGTKIGKYVIFGIVAIFAICLLISSVYVVNPGYRAVMVTLGKVEPRSIANGIGFKWPFVSTVVDMNVQTNEMTDVGTTYTKDVQTAEIKYTFTYNLNPENVWMLYERVGLDYAAKKIVPVLNDVIKDVIGRWQAQDLVASRDSARIEITALLRERVDKTFNQRVSGSNPDALTILKPCFYKAFSFILIFLFKIFRLFLSLNSDSFPDKIRFVRFTAVLSAASPGCFKGPVKLKKLHNFAFIWIQQTALACI